MNPENLPSLAPSMLAAVRTLGPVEHGPIIDGHAAAEPGIIRPAIDPLLREAWPEALFLREHHTSLSYTLETASHQSPALRVAGTVAAVEAALTALLTQAILP